MPNSNRMNWPFPSENSAPWYDSFEDMVTALDASGYASREDRNIVIAGGGALSWVLGTSTFSWTADIQILSTVTGHILTIAPDSLTLDDGEIAYVNLVRSPTTSSARTPQIASQIPGSDNAFLIALRVGDAIYFRNGQRIADGESLVGLGSGPAGAGGGSGDVVGPAGATDAAVALYSGPTGKLIKNSTLLYATGELLINDATNPTLATKERGSAPSVSATFGYHWVKNDSPNVPMFTDDDGNSNQLAYTTTYNTTGGNLRRYKYDSSTSAPPGSQFFRLNTTNEQTATEMYISQTNSDLMNMENVLSGIAPGDQIRLVRKENVAQSVLFHVTAAVDSGTYYTLTLDNTKVQESSTSWVFPADNQPVDVWLLKAGSSGSGNNVALGEWAKGDDTIGSAASGEFDVNNATIASITTIRVNALNPATGASVFDVLPNLPQSGYIYLQDVTDPGGTSVIFEVTAVAPNASTYADFTVVHKVTLGTNWSANNYSLIWVPKAITAAAGGQSITMATNELVQLDQTEVVIGGGYIDGSTGGTYTWEALATQIDGGGGVSIGTSTIRLYDMGPDGTPGAGTLRSQLEFPTDDALDRVSLTLTASGSPGTDTDTIFNTARMYEVRAYLDSTGGNVDSLSVLNVRFVES